MTGANLSKIVAKDRELRANTGKWGMVLDDMTRADEASLAGQAPATRVAFLALAEGAQGVSAAEIDAFAAEILAAERDPHACGLVLHLRGGHSLVPALAPSVSALCRQIENCTKPVIACLEGPVGGAIWALALACGQRFAAPSAQAVMPEARFGLIPGAGITQRLPRLIGAADSLRIILGTRPEPAAALLAMGAIDRIIDGDVTKAAGQAVMEGAPLRRTRDAGQGFRDPARYLAEVRAFAARVTSDPLDVSRGVVKSVEAALLLPFAAGLAFEAVTLEDLAQAPETLAVRHALAVERSVRDRLRAVSGGGKRGNAAPCARLGLWAFGPERADFVVQALSKGLEIVALNPVQADLLALLNRVAALHEALVAQKTLSPEARDADWARLKIGDSSVILASCDLILTAGAGTPDLGAPVVAMDHGLGAQVAVLLPHAKGDHAEVSLAMGSAPPRELALLQDLSRRMGWRLQVVGPDGFISPNLRRAHRALTVHLSDQGFKGPQITSGLASVGLGAMQSGGRRPVSGSEYDIGQLALAALANEGAWLLREGLAQEPQEIDAAALSMGLLPRWMGGPMYQADQRGLILLRADLARLKGEGRMAACDLWDNMIADGTAFYPKG